MNSELRGTRIFHRYHQAQHHRNDDRHHKQDDNDMFVSSTRSPSRRSAFPSRRKTIETEVDEPVRDDLTLGNYPHPRQLFATERNPLDYEASPTSSKAFRIVSLDGCYEEHVSPLCTDSSSAASSLKMRDVSVLPNIPQPPPSSVACKNRNSNLHNSLMKFKTKSFPLPDETLFLEKEQPKIKTTPLAKMKRRRSSHNRSRFVFDGNLSLGAISPTAMYTGSPNLMPISPRMMNYPNPTTSMTMTPKASMASMAPMTPMPSLSTTPMTPMTTPLQTFLGNDSINREEQNDLGRRKPPPTPKEQRRRNRAISSVQYQELLFDRISQQQEREAGHIRHARLDRQQTW